MKEEVMKDIIYQPSVFTADMPHDPLSSLRRWYREWRMSRALQALDDALLKDIGIYRCEIPWIARTRSVFEDL
jgi:uncharacterized protein YjiS (DUF1127 family)